MAMTPSEWNALGVFLVVKPGRAIAAVNTICPFGGTCSGDFMGCMWWAIQMGFKCDLVRLKMPFDGDVHGISMLIHWDFMDSTGF